jgi:hypothetical protein
MTKLMKNPNISNLKKVRTKRVQRIKAVGVGKFYKLDLLIFF